MKKLIALSLLVLSTTAFAEKCRLSATVDTKGFDRCVNIVTSVEVSNKAECKRLAETSRESGLLGILEEKEEILKIKYTFKKKSPGYKEKVKETIQFVSQEEIDDVCVIFGI